MPSPRCVSLTVFVPGYLQVRWISFHSGYDFGYLMKLLTSKRLAVEEEVFFSELKLYFPQFYDIKYLMKACEGLKGGLNKLAEDMEVERIGPEHQAGSDSLLTQATFFKMRTCLSPETCASVSG